MPRPVAVYLDTATWSAIERLGSEDPRVSLLASLGSCGAVAYLVSAEILMELPTEFLEERLDAMRALSGTSFAAMSAMDIFRTESAALTARALSTPGPSRVFDATPFVSIQRSDLDEAVGNCRKLRLMMRFFSKAESTSRRANRMLTKKDLQASEKRANAVLSGDLSKLRTRRFGRLILQAGHALLQPAIRMAVARGVVPSPDLRADRRFAIAVFPFLPKYVRRSPTLTAKVYATWKDPKTASLIRGISCAVSLAETFRFDTRRTYEASEEMDRLHAAYAPYVDIFCSDKRTFDALTRRALSADVRSGIKVIRSDRFEHLVSTIANEAALRFCDSPQVSRTP